MAVFSRLEGSATDEEAQLANAASALAMQPEEIRHVARSRCA